MKAIADTGFLVALARRADKHHTWAAELSEGIREPLLTCDAVLAETAIRERLAQLGMLPIGGSLDSGETYVRSEIGKWGEVVRTLGLKVE